MEIADNIVFKYAGQSLNAWIGVTLVFLGGNGAGSCYDVSVYSGIRFKIKGSVNSPELGGMVIMSLISALIKLMIIVFLSSGLLMEFLILKRMLL